ILSRLSRATRSMTESLERFRLDEAALTGYSFFWGEVADWYLEIVKPRLRGEMGDRSREAARSTLVLVLDMTLRLLHPLMPFITETVWQRLPRRDSESASIMTAEWPSPLPRLEDAVAEGQMEMLQEMVGAVRNLRAEYGVQPARKVSLRVDGLNDDMEGVVDASRRVLADLARVDDVTFGGAEGGVSVSAVLRSGAQIFLPLEGVIDLDRERERLRSEIDRIAAQVANTEAKLANERFVSRAPDEVVQRERDKLVSFAEQEQKLTATLRALAGSA
ncbi:MAG TPA: class I tRNA ligase family protein, partial [Longimicrobiaceae bacterium]|nr:class I tRNA ligase family protein [Longimicrobiaceae bacterium]